MARPRTARGRSRAAAVAALALGACAPAWAQQNHVVIKDFDWKYRSTEHFDIYYYDGSRPVVGEAAEIVERAFQYATKALDITVEPPPWAPQSVKKKARWQRRPLFLYASANDFEQSNIAFVGDGTGGITEPSKNRFMVYNDGTRQWLGEVITHEFIHIMQFYVLISGFWKSGEIIKSIVYPLWWIEGMPGYITYGIESSIEETTIRDAATSGALIPLTQLEHFGHLKPHQITLAYKEGASALEFLATQFGARKVGDMLRLFRSRIDTSQVLLELAGLDKFKFDEKFREFEESKYRRQVRLERLAEPESYGGALTRRPDNIPQFNTCPVPTPDGGTMFYVTTSRGYPPRIWSMDLRTGRARALSVGYGPIENIMMGNFAYLSRVMGIARDGKRLVFAGTKNHRDSLFLYDVASGRLEKRELRGFMSVSQPQFSPDGRRVVFSGMKDSVTDLYLYDLASQAVERLTDDPQDDEMPVFTPDGRAIIYSAEIVDRGRPGVYERRLYRLDLGDRALSRLESSGGEARDPIVSADGRKVLFVCADERHSDICELDLESRAVTRLTRAIGGIYTPNYAPDGEIAFASLRRGDVHIYKGPRSSFLSEPVPQAALEPEPPRRGFLPDIADVRLSSAAALLSAERPYRFAYSTDLFVPAAFYSSLGGFFGTAYWQGSDLLGNHQNVVVGDFHSGQEFDYLASYGYLRYRPQLFAGAQGRGRMDLVDPGTGDTFNDKLFNEVAGVNYPFDRYHSFQAAAQAVTERVRDTTTNTSTDNEARMTSYSLVRDTTRGRYLVAEEGNRVLATLSQASQVLGGNRAFYSASAEADQYVRLGSQNTLALRLAGEEAFGRDAPQFILGGLGGVRGYARSTTESFGNRLAVGTAEWRFPVVRDLNYYMWYFFPDFYFKAIYGSLFTDSGLAWNSRGELSSDRLRDLRTSVGVGLKIYTFILQEFEFVVAMDYARRTTQNGGIFYVYLGQLF